MCIFISSMKPISTSFSRCFGFWFLVELVRLTRCFVYISPLTPVVPETTCDECWPLFHSWRHLLWAKLTSFILKFCRRTQSFHWYPDQSEWVNWEWNMHHGRRKFSLNYAWLLGFSVVRISCLNDAFSGILELEASPVEDQQHRQKDRRKRKDEKKKKKKKSKA